MVSSKSNIRSAKSAYQAALATSANKSAIGNDVHVLAKDAEDERGHLPFRPRDQPVEQAFGLRSWQARGPRLESDGLTLQMTHEFHIQFVTVTCDVCNETRFAEEAPCGCEEQAEASDNHVQRRRRLVWNAAPLDDLDRAEILIESGLDEELFDRCSQLLERFMTSFQLLGAGQPGGSQLLRAALTDWRDMRDSVRSSRHLRPWLTFWRAVDGAIENIGLVASRYIETFICGTASEAERHAAETQDALDEATASLARYSALLDQWERVDYSHLDPLDVLPSLAAAATVANETDSIVDLDRRGAVLFERVTGDQSTEPGIGLGLVVTDFVASVMYDSELLWSKAADTYNTFMSDPAKLLSLLENKTWLDDYRAGVAELRDAAIEAAAFSAAATADRFEVRSTIRLGARLFEPIARPLVVALLAVGKGRSITRLTNKDPNVSVNQLRQAGLAHLVEGLQAGIRDADAHHKYTIEEDRIVFTSRRAEQTNMTRGQVLDTVLTGMETLHSLYFGMTCAFLAAGVAIEDLPDADAWNFSDEQRMSLVLGASGWTNIRVGRSDSTIEAKGEGRFPDNPTSLGGACLAGLSEDVMTLVLQTEGEESHTLRMDAQTFRDRESIGNPWDRDVAFIKGCARSSYDSQPIFNRDQIRKWIAVKVGEALRSSDVQAQLRSLERLARDQGDEELADSVSAAERLRLARQRGQDTDPEDIGMFDLVVDWQKRSV